MCVLTSRPLEAADELLERDWQGNSTNLLYLSIRCSTISSLTAPAYTASSQESTATATSAETSSSNSSPIPNYDDVGIPAPSSKTGLSTGTTSATPDSADEDMSLLPSKISDAAIAHAADNENMSSQDICLANDAGEDDVIPTENTSATTPNSTDASANATSATTSDSTDTSATTRDSTDATTRDSTDATTRDSTDATSTNTSTPCTTPVTDACVSIVTESEITPVLKSEEEAQATSLPASVPGPVYAKIIRPKKESKKCHQDSVKE
ncbi:dentin sialophosphoprotein-like [Sycon ciliatum]|uniref:dentin sialophosphoprotein-like n=1 Tax=Sycon ciliatum TaxID=27933 RepID=UPI0031F68CF7